MLYCDQALLKQPGDPLLLFWRAISLLKQGKHRRRHSDHCADRTTDAIRELVTVSEKRDLVVAGPLALIEAHQHASFVGKSRPPYDTVLTT